MHSDLKERSVPVGLPPPSGLTLTVTCTSEIPVFRFQASTATVSSRWMKTCQLIDDWSFFSPPYGSNFPLIRLSLPLRVSWSNGWDPQTPFWMSAWCRTWSGCWAMQRCHSCDPHGEEQTLWRNDDYHVRVKSGEIRAAHTMFLPFCFSWISVLLSLLAPNHRWVLPVELLHGLTFACGWGAGCEKSKALVRAKRTSTHWYNDIAISWRSLTCSYYIYSYLVDIILLRLMILYIFPGKGTSWPRINSGEILI